MEIRQLLSLREVVREGSFTGAARTLRMTQPAVSLHIKALEQEVGARLMDRDGKGIRLTAAGEVLHQAAEGVLASVAEATRRIRELASPERGTLVLACGDTVALHLLPAVLHAFRARRPHAELVIQNHGSQRIVDLVLRREADLGIVARPSWLDPALWARTLLVEPFFLALPLGHALAKTPQADLRALDGQPAVLLSRGTETRTLLDRGLRGAGVRLEVVMESGNLEVVKAYVAEGMGITILPEMAVTPADRQRMAFRPMPEDFPRRRVALIRRKDRLPGLLAGDLLGLLAERFRGGRGKEEGDERS